MWVQQHNRAAQGTGLNISRQVRQETAAAVTKHLLSVSPPPPPSTRTHTPHVNIAWQYKYESLATTYQTFYQTLLLDSSQRSNCSTPNFKQTLQKLNKSRALRNTFNVQKLLNSSFLVQKVECIAKLKLQ